MMKNCVYNFLLLSAPGCETYTFYDGDGWGGSEQKVNIKLGPDFEERCVRECWVGENLCLSIFPPAFHWGRYFFWRPEIHSTRACFHVNMKPEKILRGHPYGGMGGIAQNLPKKSYIASEKILLGLGIDNRLWTVLFLKWDIHSIVNKSHFFKKNNFVWRCGQVEKRENRENREIGKVVF